MIAMVVAIYQVVGSYDTAFAILVGAVMIIGALIAVIGWFMVKEKHIIAYEKDDKVRLRDFISLLKTNKAMVIYSHL